MFPRTMADFERSVRNDVSVLVVRGSLDAQSAATLKPEVVAIGDSGTKKVLVDLEGLSLIDSSGVGVLISLFKRVRGNGGQVCFSGVKAQPKEVFRLLRLDRSLDICSTVEDALKKLSKKNLHVKNQVPSLPTPQPLTRRLRTCGQRRTCWPMPTVSGWCTCTTPSRTRSTSTSLWYVLPHVLAEQAGLHPGG